MSMVAQQAATSKISLEVARMAAAGLKVAQPGNDSLWRALDKAVELIEQGHPMELRGNVLHVASASREGIDYATMLNECPCETTQGCCWHRAACALFVSVQTIEAVAGVCEPLVAKPRRQRTAKPALAGIEVRAAMQASRASRGLMSDDKYRQACAAADELF